MRLTRLSQAWPKLVIPALRSRPARPPPQLGSIPLAPSSNATVARQKPIPRPFARLPTPSPTRPPWPAAVRAPSGAPRAAFTRSFHSSPTRQDVFFVTVPEFKETLLMITRVTLVALPLAWRYGWFKRFPSGARTLIWLPIASFMIVVGLGLQQSPKTARWRLLLMSKPEMTGKPI